MEGKVKYLGPKYLRNKNNVKKYVFDGLVTILK